MSLNVSLRKRCSRRYWLGKENKNIKPSAKEKLSKKLSSKKRAKQKQKTRLSSYLIKTVFVVSCIVLVSLCLGRASYLGRSQEDKRELLNQSAFSQKTYEPSSQLPTALSQESAKAQESEVEFWQLSEEAKKLCSIFDMRNSSNSTLSTQDLLSIKGFPTQLGQVWRFSLSCGGTQAMEELLQNCKNQGGYQLEHADFLDLQARVFSALIKEEKSGEIFLLCAQDLNQKELKGEVYLVQLEQYEQAEKTEP